MEVTCMAYSSKKVGVLTARRSGFLFLVFTLAAFIFLSVPRSQAQDQPPAGALRGYVSPPPGAEADYPIQPVTPPTRSAPVVRNQNENPFQGQNRDDPDQEERPSRLPYTVSPPPETHFDVNIANLGFRVVSAAVVDRIFLPTDAKQKVLEPEPGKKLVVVKLLGITTRPIKMPIAVSDFSAFWVEEQVRNLYGKGVTDRIVQVARAVTLETPRGWLIEGKGLPDAALFYFVDPGPVSLRVGFSLPEGLKRFGVRYPLVAPGGDAIIAPGTPPANK